MRLVCPEAPGLSTVGGGDVALARQRPLGDGDHAEGRLVTAGQAQGSRPQDVHLCRFCIEPAPGVRRWGQDLRRHEQAKGAFPSL